MTLKTLRLLCRIFDETEFSLEQKDILSFSSDHYQVFYKNKLLTEDHTDISFYFVDRTVYDDFLLKKAKEAGAKIIQSERIDAIIPSKGEAVTSTGRVFREVYCGSRWS